MKNHLKSSHPFQILARVLVRRVRAEVTFVWRQVCGRGSTVATSCLSLIKLKLTLKMMSVALKRWEDHETSLQN